MPSPGELIHSLHSTLSATLEHTKVIDEYEEKAEAAKAQYDATAQELDATRKQLEAAKAALAEAESILKSKRHLINDEAARSLLATQRQVAAKQEELKTLDIAVKQLQGQHDNLIASLRAIKDRVSL